MTSTEEGQPGVAEDPVPPAAGTSSLGATAARGGAILGAATAIETGVQVVRAIVLARILTPKDFGLMGMALVAIQAAEAFSQTGFARALVQTRKDPSDYLDTVFVVGCLRGLLLMGCGMDRCAAGGRALRNSTSGVHSARAGKDFLHPGADEPRALSSRAGLELREALDAPGGRLHHRSRRFHHTGLASQERRGKWCGAS